MNGANFASELQKDPGELKSEHVIKHRLSGNVDTSENPHSQVGQIRKVQMQTLKEDDVGPEERKTPPKDRNREQFSLGIANKPFPSTQGLRDSPNRQSDDQVGMMKESGANPRQIQESTPRSR